MTVEIATRIAQAIRDAAAASPDEEVCGLLLGTAERVEALQPARNVAADPRTSFEIDPQALLAAYRAARAGGPAVVGHYHSHPAGPVRPSAADAAASHGDGALWIIANAETTGCWRAVARGPVAGRFVPVALRFVG
ncbi:M67 family metallopeptidase [Sphingomonas sp. PL-96]|uniref:Mov34/MPN/PAD-1 family protein n=1 Tax=Sphingomonas sp. PL-96 TaxID=2887201 RepID=UPI001E409954|nr:M67 family metallopeptidase [Sphingomonas sp. PL-96]MCC2976148.1 M67 family metallopeptidase [Sphingomonas sp. PL-96]